MFLREYETTIILRADLPPSVLDTTVERMRDVVNNNGGKMLEINHWGKKKLAYDINKQSRGIYFHTMFLGEGPTVKELERTLKLSDNVLRFLTIILNEKVDPAERNVKEYERPKYDAEDEEGTKVEASEADEAEAPAEDEEAEKTEATEEENSSEE